MHILLKSHRAALFASAALMALGLPPLVQAAPFPPITSPATAQHRPGKLVWADLFTSDQDASTKFYCGLLGWTAAVVDQKGRPYTIFSNSGTPVAGLAPHSYGKEKYSSRWVGYVSVADAAATVAGVVKNGGAVHAPVRNFPDRGYQAIVGDDEGVVIGLLQSTSGDPADTDTAPGDWNWFEIYSKDPRATSDFYSKYLGFDAAPETQSDRKSDFVLSSGGTPRGGIAPLPDGADTRPSWLGIIRVADLDQTLAKVAGLGGEILVKPHSVEFGSRFAIILDPTGGTIGLVQYIDSANPAKSP
jgi:predicted enzyme related to lactoylglutathione lyase